MPRAHQFFGIFMTFAVMLGGTAEAAEYKYRIRRQLCAIDDSCPTSPGSVGLLSLSVAQGNPDAMDIAGGSSPGANVVFTITNTGGQASGALAVSIGGDTANFSKTADTCNGGTLAASANCSITIQPVAATNGSYTGTLQVSATPGGTVSRALSGTASGFAVNPGAVMPDGTVYVGLSPDGNVPMYVTRCDAGMTWDGSACTGTRSALGWDSAVGDGRPNDHAITGITNINTGVQNTAALAVLSGYGAPYLAAQYCDSLVQDGRIDWYLPAKAELNIIYQASVAAGGWFRNSFDTVSGFYHSVYWTSTESDYFYAWNQYFDTGVQNGGNLSGKQNGFSVRCACKGDAVAPTASGLSPADGAVDVAVDANLVITFSENVQVGIGDIIIKKSSDNAVVETINVADAGKVGIAGAVATINPDATLANGTGYYVTVDSGAFTDMSDNPFAGISGSTAWNFTTVSAPVDPCAGSPVAGDVCADGAVYAGLSPDGNERMYVTRCDAGMTWDGAQCAGTRPVSGLYNWNDGSGNWTVTGASSAITGYANTALLAGLAQNHIAPRDCWNLDAYGHDDWYLPAKNELDVIYQAAVSAGGAFQNSFAVGCPTCFVDQYWSSTESDNTYAWHQNFADGTQYSSYFNKSWQLTHRCARKDDTVAPAVSGRYPADGETGVARDTHLVLTFSENVEKGSGSIVILKALDNSVLETIPVGDAKVAVSGGVVTINPDATPEDGTEYYVTVDGSAFVDRVGAPFAGISGNSAWNFTTGLPCTGGQAVGTLCGDGSIYVGLSPDGNLPMYVTRCDAGMTWDGAQCAGTRPVSGLYNWNDGSGNWTVTGASSAVTGAANTTLLAGLAQNHIAPRDCANLVMYGHDDWYLPAKNELNVVYQASVSVGGAFRASFSTGSFTAQYWSSTESDSMYTWHQDFGNGTQYSNYFNKSWQLTHRCARKATATFGMSVPQGDPAAMDITGGISPGSDVVFTITNVGDAASGAMTVSLTGDTGNFDKTADTCNGQTLAASATCSITVQPVATTNVSYTGTLSVSAAPGGTVSRALSGTASGFVVDLCAGSPLAGDVCTDGTVYAGLSPDGNVPMYVTRCDAGMSWNGSACTGTRLGISWDNGASNWIQMGINNTSAGEANTAMLAGFVNAASPYQAAIYCHDLVLHGKSDWYLPARDELTVVYTNNAAIGGFDLSGAHVSGWYWSSSEYDLNDYTAWPRKFSDGIQPPSYKYWEMSIRCVRKEGSALGMTVPQGDPAAMDIAGGSSPGANVVFTITNVGEAASGAMTVSLTGDTGNFDKTADTCNGQTLAASATCSITVQPVATTNVSYTGTLSVSAAPGGTVSRSLSGTASGFDTSLCSVNFVIGCKAADGAIYAGNFNGDLYVDDSTTQPAPAWSTVNVVTNATSDTDGVDNTNKMLASAGTYPSASYCRTTYGSNWYLPAKNELNYLYQNRVAVGGFDTAAVFSSRYWSSTELVSNAAWYQIFYDGTLTNAPKTTNNYAKVRCARR